MEAVAAALPELDGLRHDAQATPVRRSGDVLALLGDLRPRLLERLARRDDLRLRAGRRADARGDRPRGPVGVGLLVADALDGAGDDHLALQPHPGEHGARARVRERLAALAGFEVRVEGKAALVDPAQQHRARTRRAAV